MRKIYFLLYFFITSCFWVVQAQNVVECKELKILSAPEMLSLFYDKYIPYIKYDQIDVPGWFSPSIVTPSPLASLVQEKIYAEWKIIRNDSILYLTHIAEPLKHTNMRTNGLFQVLSERYGNTKNGIFASWFTGRLFVLICPHRLFGMIVSKDAIFYEIENGKVQRVQKMYLPCGDFENTCLQTLDGRLMVRQDGCWYDDIYGNLNEKFTTFLNKDIPNVFVDFSKKQFSFFLDVNPKNKKVSLFLLTSVKMTDENKKVIAYLKRRIEELPSNCFGPLITIDKKVLYGRYLQIIFNNGKFETQDYILE